MERGRTFAIIVVFLSTLSATHAAKAQTGRAEQAPLSLSIRAVQPIVRAGSPVMVEVIMKNISDHGIPDFRGSRLYYPRGLALDVLDRSGASPPETKLGERLKRGADLPVRTVFDGPQHSPGESWEDLLYVSGPYDLSRPGEYTISVRQRLTSTLVVDSNTITVTVLDAPTFDQKFAQTGASFLLTITTMNDTVKPGADIVLRTYISNLTGHEIKFDAAKMPIAVYDSHGNLAPWTGGPEWRRIMDTGNGLTGGAEAYGTTGNDFCHLDKLYDLSKPGKYTIQASRFDDESKTWVKSNTITLTVVP
jgi:hypothetical protein